MRPSLFAHGAALLALCLAGCSASEPMPGDAMPPAEREGQAAAVPQSAAGDDDTVLPRLRRPVLLSSEAGNLDPCALGVINDPPVGPEPGAILVYGADHTDNDTIDTLVHGDKLWVCEASGEMLGVVYARDGTADCALTAPQDGNEPYRGPCASGWVNRRWVEIIAG